MECQVCVQVSAKPIVCFNCSFLACATCSERYLVGEDQRTQPHCMKCKIRWKPSFVHSVFTNSFINSLQKGSWRLHQKRLAVEREVSKLPETLAQLPLHRERKANRKKLREDMALHKKQKTAVQTTWKEIRRTQALLRKSLSGPRITGFEFLCPCPRKSCRGRVKVKTFKCIVCERRVCSRCWMPVEREEAKHECALSDLKTIRLLRKDTKGCPGCAKPIHKTEGCDQMWCVECQTPFSWETGRIVTQGTIHNPHALRFQQVHRRPLVEEREPCGVDQLPSLSLCQLILSPPTERSEGANELLESIYRRIGEIGYTLTIIDRRLDELADNLDLRFEYVENELTEVEFEQKVFLKERARLRLQEYRQILAALKTCSLEAFHRLTSESKSGKRKAKANWTIGDLAQKKQKTSPLIPVNGGTDLSDPVLSRLMPEELSSRCSKTAPMDFIEIQERKKQLLQFRRFEAFFKSMETIRVYFNTQFKKELTILGTKNPLQVPENWNFFWSNTGVNRVHK